MVAPVSWASLFPGDGVTHVTCPPLLPVTCVPSTVQVMCTCYVCSVWRQSVSSHVLGMCVPCQWHACHTGPITCVTPASVVCISRPSPACGACAQSHVLCDYHATVLHLAGALPQLVCAPHPRVDCWVGRTCPLHASMCAPCTHKLHEHTACGCPCNGDPWAHVVPAGRLSPGVLGVWEPARGFLPWGSCCGVPAAGLLPWGSSQVLTGHSGSVFPFCAPRPSLSTPDSWHQLSTPTSPYLLDGTNSLDTEHPSALLPQQQASGTSPPPATRRPSADLAGTGLKSLPRSSHSTASHCSGLWMAHPAFLLPRQCPRGLFSRTPAAVPFTPEMRVSRMVFRCGPGAPAPRVSSL